MSLRVPLLPLFWLPFGALVGCAGDEKDDTDVIDDGSADGSADGASDGSADGGDDTGGEPDEPVWSYEGETGPEHWGDLSDEWATCGEGEAQSPIDIVRGAVVAGEGALPALSWGPTALNAYNSGHYIRYNVDLGSTLEHEGRTYGLEQLHFHGVSEHTVEGAHFDMEVHFVHADLADPSRVLVVAAFGEVAADLEGATTVFGPEGALRFYDALGLAESETPTSLEADIDLGAAFPGLFADGLLAYSGSFTTPPCTEGVQFFIASGLLQLPPADMDAFLGVYDFNYRPVQPLNGREISFFAPRPG